MKPIEKAGILAVLLGSWSLLAIADPIGGLPTQVVASEVMLRGTVQKVSPFLKEMKIKVADGNTVNMKVDPDVVPIKEVKKGDQVEVRYLESVAIAIDDARKTLPVRAAANAVEVSPAQGAKPAQVVRTTVVTATVEDLDKANRIITLRDADRNRNTLKASPDLAGFDDLKIGDRIVTTYTDAVAIEVRHI